MGTGNPAKEFILRDERGNRWWISEDNRGLVDSRIVDSNGDAWELEVNGGMPVNIQDQATPPIDSYFLQSISNFTLASDTVASGTTTLQYVFEASVGHGIVATDEVLLLDVAGNRSFYSTVISVSTNAITVDRPIDHLFPSISTLGRIVTSEMAVDGSVTPQIFTIRAGDIPADHVRFILTMLSGSSMDDGLFGSLPALTRGLVLRIVNSFQRTIFCFKTNGEISQFCYDINYSDKAPAGQYGFRSRITFGGQDKHGVILRISDDDVIQWIVQDNLTDLVSFKGSTMGHDTQD